ncbi:uncharacterized protein LOC108602698 isoform X1 [Drosophila busckii]|uniref:uncharacterized protein LOC108602698 isoform X1 n=1 Tax=Drosophila busckii TaxID=30019 RepID=UPI00083F17C0|nr:uncharacterized protein LOC108602698 isoform X1 [Drosophila busckii]XP_017846336.1 uncharacterized protein LOC108602698 isoform X1 [Drosophila busckii]
MVKEDNLAADGADEEMLGTNGVEDKLTERRDEVKFIKGDQKNGDAKIDIGNLNGGKQAFTGMSKEELMKYANDPFWVRLRWIFFVAFWAIWVGMLVGAVLIIIGAPKCAAPQPLPWYKRGLHAKYGNMDAAKPEDVLAAKKLSAAGAIYELPAALTYDIKKPEVEAQIKRLIELYKLSDVKIILDVTPNFVSNNSELWKEALAQKEKRDAFVWVSGGGSEPPNNWKKVGGDTSAWEKVDGSYVLSQFQPGNYDLKMNSTLVRREFGGVLKHLVGLGVEGFRLKNTKFFLISNNLADEEISQTPKDMNLVAKDYGFYLHTRTTFQSGLGDVLYDYLGIVKNASADTFLSVAEDLIRPESYILSKSGGALGIDLPMYGEFVKTLSSSNTQGKLQQQLQQTYMDTFNNSWLQWNFDNVYVDTRSHASSLALFMSLLSGVPVVSVDSIEYRNVSEATYKQIEQLRLSPSFMHGEINVYEGNQLIAYTRQRIKSGSPGYFVIFNPTDVPRLGNFTADHMLPDKMTVSYFSENYNSHENVPKVSQSNKVNLKELQMAPHSTLILTYVPVKTE